MKKIRYVVVAVIIVMAVGVLVYNKSNQPSEIDLLTKGKDTRKIVADLENNTEVNIEAAVYSNGIELREGDITKQLIDADNKFYVSIAPYLSSTHG